MTSQSRRTSKQKEEYLVQKPAGLTSEKTSTQETERRRQNAEDSQTQNTATHRTQKLTLERLQNVKLTKELQMTEFEEKKDPEIGYWNQLQTLEQRLVKIEQKKGGLQEEEMSKKLCELQKQLQDERDKNKKCPEFYVRDQEEIDSLSKKIQELMNTRAQDRRFYEVYLSNLSSRKTDALEKQQRRNQDLVGQIRELETSLWAALQAAEDHKSVQSNLEKQLQDEKKLRVELQKDILELKDSFEEEMSKKLCELQKQGQLKKTMSSPKLGLDTTIRGSVFCPEEVETPVQLPCQSSLHQESNETAVSSSDLERSDKRALLSLLFLSLSFFPPTQKTNWKSSLWNFFKGRKSSSDLQELMSSEDNGISSSSGNTEDNAASDDAPSSSSSSFIQFNWRSPLPWLRHKITNTLWYSKVKRWWDKNIFIQLFIKFLASMFISLVVFILLILILAF